MNHTKLLPLLTILLFPGLTIAADSAVYFDGSKLAEFLDLSDALTSDSDQVKSWLEANGKEGLPNARGSYLSYSRETTGGAKSLFIGPYTYVPTDDLVLLSKELSDAVSGDPSLLRGKALIVNQTTIQAIATEGVENWTRRQSQSSGRTSNAIRQAQVDANRLPPKTEMSAIAKTQLVAARNSALTGTEVLGVRGLTLGESDVSTMDTELGRYLVQRAFAPGEYREFLRSGISADQAHSLLTTATKYFRDRKWTSEDTASWVNLRVRDILQPNNSRQAFTAAQFKDVLRSLGRLYPATAEREWGYAPGEVLSPAPSARKLQRSVERFRDEGEKEIADIIDKNLPFKDSILDDRMDLAEFALSYRLDPDNRVQISQDDVDAGLSALIKGSERFATGLTEEQLADAIDAGAEKQVAQRIANTAQRLIGTMPMIEAVGTAAVPSQELQWSKQSVREIVGRIGIAERRSRLIDTIADKQEHSFDFHQANEEGVAGSDRQEFEEALGEVAGAGTTEEARSKGKEILESTTATSNGQVSASDAQNAIESAAEASGTEADGDSGDSAGGSDGGSGGAIPVDSLPALEFLTRLLAQYFGVEAYLKQAAMLCYMFAPDLVNQLVDKLKEANEAFGDDVNKLALEGNKFLNKFGPLMGDIGALAETAADEGLKEAAKKLADLALKDFKQDKIDELKADVAADLNLDVAQLDLIFEGALSLPDDFELETLSSFAKDQIDSAAREATLKILGDAGLDPAMIEGIGKRDWDALGHRALSSAKDAAITNISEHINLPDNIAAMAANEDWSSFGPELIDHTEKEVYKAAEEELGISRSVIQNASAYPELASTYLSQAGAVADVLGDQFTGDSISAAVSAGADQTRDLVAERLSGSLDRYISETANPMVEDALSAVKAGGISSDVFAEARSALKIAVSKELRDRALPWAPVFELGIGNADDSGLRAAAAQLDSVGVLPNLAQRLNALPEGGDTNGVYENVVLEWFSSKIDFRFYANTPCHDHIANGSTGPTIIGHCSSWLASKYGDTEATIESTLIADPNLMDDIRVGDRSALIRALYQHILSSSDLSGTPTNVVAGTWRQLGRRSLSYNVDQWANSAVNDAWREFDYAANPAGPAQFTDALAAQQFPEAASILAEQYQRSGLLNAYRDARIIEILSSEKSPAQINTELAEYLASRTESAGVKRLSNDSRYGVVGEALGCAVAIGDDCENVPQRARSTVIELELPKESSVFRRAVADSNPALAVGVIQSELDRVALNTLGVTPEVEQKCGGKSDPGCLLVEGKIQPVLRESIPTLTADNASTLITSSQLDLTALKALARDLSSSSELSSLLPGIDTDDPGKSLSSFGNTPSFLADPDAKSNAIRSLVTESYRTVLGEAPDKDLLNYLVGEKQRFADPQCVDVVVNAFIPSTALSNENPVFLVPGSAPAKYMIPGPMATVTQYAGIPYPRELESRINEDDVKFFSTCYVGDSRGFAAPNVKGATSRVSLAFTLRTGDFGATIDPGSIVPSAHPTQAVDCETGVMGESKSAETRYIRVVPSHTQENGTLLASAAVELGGKNPLVPAPFSPLLELEGVFTYSPSTLTLSFSGNREAFPAYEAYARLNGGDWQTVFTEGPEKGASAFSILDANPLSEFHPISVPRLKFAGQSSTCSARLTHKEQVSRRVHEYLDQGYAKRGDLSHAVRIETALALATEAREPNSQDLVLRDAEYYLHGLLARTEFTAYRLGRVAGAPVYDAIKFVSHRLNDSGYDWLDKIIRADEESPTSPPGGWPWAWSGVIDARKIDNEVELTEKKYHPLALTFPYVD